MKFIEILIFEYPVDQTYFFEISQFLFCEFYHGPGRLIMHFKNKKIEGYVSSKRFNIEMLLTALRENRNFCLTLHEDEEDTPEYQEILSQGLAK